MNTGETDQDLYAKPISDAARIVRSRLPRDVGIELDELVSIGWERVLRYRPSSTVLAFVCARQGMVEYARMSRGRDRNGRERRSGEPVFVALDEGRDVAVWDQWRRHALPLEEMIDAKRALLGMQLREAVAWYSHHWLCEELDHLERELGVSEGRIRQYCRDARDKLAAAWRGERHATEDEIAVLRTTRVAANATRQAESNARMLAERRRRYAELRALGASSAAAQRAAGSTTRYATLVRQLSGEHGGTPP